MAKLLLFIATVAPHVYVRTLRGRLVACMSLNQVHQVQASSDWLPGLWVGPGCSRAKVGLRPGSVRAKIIGVPGDVGLHGADKRGGQVCSERNKLADAWAQATKHSLRLTRLSKRGEPNKRPQHVFSLASAGL